MRRGFPDGRAFTGLLQAHGADVYDARGTALPGLDFSSTVVSLGPPRGWRQKAAAALDSLTRYPQPRGRGLDSFLERALSLPKGSVLVSNGASEALEWCARLGAGRRARLLAPCFGEYRAKLERCGVDVEERAWDGASAPDPEALTRGLRRGDQVWLANPSNPLGRVFPSPALAALEAVCRRRGVLLVLDEALMSQRLDPGDAAAGPGSFPGAKDNPCLAVVRSMGKGLGLPGLRLGYLAAEPTLTARLRRFQDPWSVNALALELGAWAFEEEARAVRVRERRRLLWDRSLDLRTRLAALAPPSGAAVPSPSTGYFCLRLWAPAAAALSARLARQGFFVRDCSSFGAWGRSWLRLNPRGAPENRAFARALSALWGRA